MIVVSPCSRSSFLALSVYIYERWKTSFPCAGVWVLECIGYEGQLGIGCGVCCRLQLVTCAGWGQKQRVGIWHEPPKSALLALRKTQTHDKQPRATHRCFISSRLYAFIAL